MSIYILVLKITHSTPTLTWVLVLLKDQNI